VHVADIGMLAAADQAILAHAASSGLVIISADTNFGELLAVTSATLPSVVLLRSADHLTPDQQATLLVANSPPSPPNSTPAPPYPSPAAGSASGRSPSTPHPTRHSAKQLAQQHRPPTAAKPHEPPDLTDGQH